MLPLVRYEIRDRVAVVTIDNPPVNALSAGVMVRREMLLWIMAISSWTT